MVRAFTLVELLVVIAIVATLAAILFPVFAAARGGALRAACQSNLHQISLGAIEYTADYDDYFMPINYQPGGATPTSRNDRTWVQMLLPYIRSFDVFRCPADYSARPTADQTFDQDLVPGDTDSQYYRASQHSDYGYNYQNLAPIVQTQNGWEAEPRQTVSVAEPSGTVEFMDSVWSRDANGNPMGGGNWLVVPPARYYAAVAGEQRVDSFTGAKGLSAKVYTNTYGWRPSDSSASNLYGGAWPWHRGRLNVVEVDGSIRSLDPSQLTQGCNLQGFWNGSIIDYTSYMWDLR